MIVELLTNPGMNNRLGDVLLTQLRDEKWTAFRAAVAFVKRSGVQCLDAALRDFARRAEVKISVGVDFGGTSEEGLVQLFDAAGGDGHIWVFHNTNGSTFHPKVFLFRNQDAAFIVLGSGNLTRGGLFTNYEAALAVSLDLSAETDKGLLTLLEQKLDSWIDGTQGICHALDSKFLDELIDAGYLPPEVYSSDADDGGLRNPDDDATKSLFEYLDVPPPPQSSASPLAPHGPHRTTSPQVYLMTLMHADVSRGQATPGASPRSAEIYIPLAARDAAPEFWEWPTAFMEDAGKAGKMDRVAVPMLIGAQIESVTMMTWPDRSDFRLRCEALRSAGTVGDILRIEKTPFAIGYQYVANIIPQRTSQYAAELARCANSVRNSTRRWGYV